MQKVIVLGNCVAGYVQAMLQKHTGLRERYHLLLAPPVHGLRSEEEQAALARGALSCQWIITQPLFRFGPCNTEALRAKLGPGQRLLTFSAPNFDAYFPDVLHVSGVPDERFAPPLEWHSRIILQCYLAGMSILDVEACYLHHPLFRRKAMERALEAAWKTYAVRERGVDLGTLERVRRDYACTPLFQTWQHPADELLQHMFELMLDALGLEVEANDYRPSFGFNQWPIITRHHDLFAFQERGWFRVAEKQLTIEDAAAAYYTYYDFHPAFVAKARAALGD